MEKEQVTIDRDEFEFLFGAAVKQALLHPSVDASGVTRLLVTRGALLSQTARIIIAEYIIEADMADCPPEHVVLWKHALSALQSQARVAV